MCTAIYTDGIWCGLNTLASRSSLSLCQHNWNNKFMELECICKWAKNVSTFVVTASILLCNDITVHCLYVCLYAVRPAFNPQCGRCSPSLIQFADADENFPRTYATFSNSICINAYVAWKYKCNLHTFFFMYGLREHIIFYLLVNRNCQRLVRHCIWILP